MLNKKRGCVVGAVALMTIGLAACGGGETSSGTGTQSPVDRLGGTVTEELPFGPACRDHPDAYNYGMLNIYDGYGGVVPTKLDDLGNHIVISDGPLHSNGADINEFDPVILDQIRQSLAASDRERPNSKPSRVYLYGKSSDEVDNTDGKINEGLKACVG